MHSVSCISRLHLCIKKYIKNTNGQHHKMENSEESVNQINIETSSRTGLDCQSLGERPVYEPSNHPNHMVQAQTRTGVLCIKHQGYW